jgi:hypothetical protein
MTHKQKTKLALQHNGGRMQGRFNSPWWNAQKLVKWRKDLKRSGITEEQAFERSEPIVQLAMAKAMRRRLANMR